MKDITVIRLDDTERVSFGPLSHYQPIVGDDAGSTPVRTGIQTALPGYAAPVHSHPYIEILHILDGVAEAWIDGRPESWSVLRKGDTIAVPPETPHAFRVVGDQVPAPARHPRLPEAHRQLPGRGRERPARLPQRGELGHATRRRGGHDELGRLAAHRRRAAWAARGRPSGSGSTASGSSTR